MRRTRSKDDMFMAIAKACASQSTCLRRHYGAVIVNHRGELLSTGYNGAPRSMQHCQVCPREVKGSAPGEDYEICRSTHAEWNALIQAGRASEGSTMYLFGEESDGTPNYAVPCFQCAKLLVNAGIRRIVIRKTTDSYVSLLPQEIYREWAECYTRGM